MSHGASTVTRATQGAAKASMTQAEMWDKVSAVQKGLLGLTLRFDMLDKALRAFAPSIVVGPDVVDIPAIQRDCENSSSLFNAMFDHLDNQSSLRNNAKSAISQFTSQFVLSELHTTNGSSDQASKNCINLAWLLAGWRASWQASLA